MKAFDVTASDLEVEELKRLSSMRALISNRELALGRDKLILEESVKSESLKIPKPTGLAFDYPTPLHLLKVLAPELVPHNWQVQTLLLVGGHTDPSNPTSRETPDPEAPMYLAYPCANGSGKDQFIIAATAVWFVMVGLSNRCIITTASQEQMKRQTEPYIQFLCERANLKLGKCFDTIQFYKKCLVTGSEIQMFVTDEPRLAEGYHPFPGGKMMVIINEAKEIPEEIFDALSRCTGFSYWIEISSPGPTQGHFYRSAQTANHYPAKCVLGQYYTRKISVFDCPHIAKSYIEKRMAEMEEWWIKSSLLAEFVPFSSSSVITWDIWDRCEHSPPEGDDIGIGADLAAGNDECSIYVRRGNQIVDEYHFVQKDTEISADLINSHLLAYKSGHYTFNADDGGIGRAIIDKLTRLGWRITRRLNNSPPYNRQEFLNLGAQMYFHLKRQMANGRVRIFTKNNTLLRQQLTNRVYEQQAGGKFKLEDKKVARGRNRYSPDRADAYVLCFFSWRPNAVPKPASAESPSISFDDFAQKFMWGKLGEVKPVKSKVRTFLRGLGI